MDLILYNSADTDKHQSLARELASTIRDARFFVCRSVVELRRRLQQPADALLAVVLLVVSASELDEILPFKEILHGLRVIIVMDESIGADAVGKAHILRPRFLAYMDDDAGKTSAVLLRMAGRMRGSNNGAAQRNGGKDAARVLDVEKSCG